MPPTKLNNGQLPNTISSKTIDNSNTINTDLTKLSVTGGTNGQVLSTNGSGSLSWGAVSYAQIQDVSATSRLLGRASAGAGDIEEITIGTGLTLTGTTISSNVSDGDKGDITVSSSGAAWTIDNDSVTYAKIQNVSATSRLLGRATAGAGDVEEITIGSGLTLTGTTISASGGGGGGDIPTTMIVKSASESVTNSDTLQVDDELIFTGEVETHYYFEAVIFWHRSNIIGSGDQPGIKIAFGNDVSTNGFFSTIPGNSTTTPTGASGVANVSLSPSMFRPYACKVSGSFYVPAGQDARLWFRWAQVTPSSTIGTVVQKGSKLLVWKLT